MQYIASLVIMLSLLVVFAAGSLLCSALNVPKSVYLPEDYEKHFKEFIIEYNRTYTSEDEKQMRFNIFKQNLENINEQNLKSTTAVFGITFATDMTLEEVKSKYMGFIPSEGQSKPISEPDPSWKKAPAQHDWRDHEAVTQVKDQADCGSCWAFSMIGNLEGVQAIKTKKLLDFSEQQLVDCVVGADGCFGGNMELAAKYLVEKGAELSSAYPYIAMNDKCTYDKDAVKVLPKDYKLYTGLSEDKLKDALYNVGPLAIGVDAKPFLAYKNGILLDCSYSQLNHGVVLVGYGTENGIPYWIIKNSWGVEFGEKGYIRVKYGVNCLTLATGLITSIVL